MADAHKFETITFEAEHLPEEHYGPRDQGREHLGTLPGLVNLYAVIDGGRVLIDQLKAPVVFEAIGKAAAKRQAEQEAQAAQAESEQTSQAAQRESEQAAQAEQQAADQTSESQTS